VAGRDHDAAEHVDGVAFERVVADDIAATISGGEPPARRHRRAVRIRQRRFDGLGARACGVDPHRCQN
jgi:hypothetical protein